MCRQLWWVVPAAASRGGSLALLPTLLHGRSTDRSILPPPFPPPHLPGIKWRFPGRPQSPPLRCRGGKYPGSSVGVRPSTAGRKKHTDTYPTPRATATVLQFFAPLNPRPSQNLTSKAYKTKNNKINEVGETRNISRIFPPERPAARSRQPGPRNNTSKRRGRGSSAYLIAHETSDGLYLAGPK